MLKKCFGIISYMPEEPFIRPGRQFCLNRLLTQLNELWPSIDILIIAQNWRDDIQPALPEINNNLNIINCPNKLGILGARQKLREEYLKLDYDYIIMLDDDAVISFWSNNILQEYLDTIDDHPNGFAFVTNPVTKPEIYTYGLAPLNLCAISTAIYSQAPFADFSVELYEAEEDQVYATLLHNKFAEAEFSLPAGLSCAHYKPIQFIRQNTRPTEYPPSTWFPGNHWPTIWNNDQVISKYIVEHKDIDEAAIRSLPE